MTGDAGELSELIREAMESGMSAQTILDDGLIAGMDIIGEKMSSGEMFIPEVLRSAKAMSGCIEYLTPMLGEDSNQKRGTIVIGTVKGDLHDIGKNLVSMMLESGGFEVIDLGIDVPPEKFVTAVREKDADMLCMSALLTTTMPMMKTTIDAITEAGLKDHVKILVGGAPVTNTFADGIQADGYSPDAGFATKLAKQLLL